jgi:putative transport protein
MWIRELWRGGGGAEAVAHALLLLAVVAVCGLALGSIRIRGIDLGIAGVLFAGIGFGHFGAKIEPEIAHFVREFGLVLFVYTIGMQVGPGFFASLRRNGLPLNAMAAAIVLLGVAMAWGFAMTLPREQRPVAVGLLAGAVTNTPSLAAVQQAMNDVSGLSDDAKGLPGIGYAIAYPFGIIGIILTMLLTRFAFRINVPAEVADLARRSEEGHEKLSGMNLEVRNANLDGLALRDVPGLEHSGVVVSRLTQGGQGAAARPETVLKLGDVLHAVGPKEMLEKLRLIVGAESKIDVTALPGNVTPRRGLVTARTAYGQTLGELNLRGRLGVNVTRVNRTGIELAPTSGLRLQFGDQVVLVGEPGALQEAVALVGDSAKKLSHPQIIPIFIGIALGVVVGSWPLHVPGMPAPLKLGLAGGPLLVAILLSRLGHFGPVVWYLPAGVNHAIRELGIVLFLAVVGLSAGGKFFHTLGSTSGLIWLGYGAAITLVPLLIVAAFARLVMKTNYATICGLLAGSMTDPPALAFAGTVTNSDGPSIAYATVYPAVMLLRVLTAQGLAIYLMT